MGGRRDSGEAVRGAVEGGGGGGGAVGEDESVRNSGDDLERASDARIASSTTKSIPHSAPRPLSTRTSSPAAPLSSTAPSGLGASTLDPPAPPCAGSCASLYRSARYTHVVRSTSSPLRSWRRTHAPHAGFEPSQRIRRDLPAGFLNQLEAPARRRGSGREEDAQARQARPFCSAGPRLLLHFLPVADEVVVGRSLGGSGGGGGGGRTAAEVEADGLL